MGKRTIDILTCDICGTESKEKEISQWAQFSRDDRFLDRSWHERAVCPSCTRDIQEAIKRKAK